MRGSLLGDRRHGRHEDALYVRSFARPSRLLPMPRESVWDFLLRTFVTSRWAAYTHDIGELAVPVSTWMRAGALTARETDAAHLHPYHGERALASLGGEGEPVAALVLRHHERLDGSGYHRYAKAPTFHPPPAS